MTVIYPVIIKTAKPESEKYYLVTIPDLEINTKGTDIADCVRMARDAIGGTLITREDMSLPIPDATPIRDVRSTSDEIVTLVDVDLTEYRRKAETKVVRRNVTLPSWLDMEAKKAKINVSQVLQKALRAELNV